ncbi:hypothetical protein SAMN06297468_1304 [Altererythrobacter xiamenensis]|uniref:Uncharacterized protein n=1 Tax=Altererythrobacter xiamenensis TaxID=1316679 RepID=A0A1Y6F2I0_9SPHN|nr:hypothetical protein [Altererythrobacter xiamenensis]SMQ69055.1 hypothetical protein SAMN06297468_1304 [Altererythrobacter xiamenensis]
MKRILTAAILASAAFAAPAAAQDEAGDKVNMVIVYGDDACPPPAEGEITVCARKDENERFRIPENLRTSDSPQNVAWAERVERFEMVGDFGTLSCDPAGAGGFLGCTQQMIDAAYADREDGSDVRFSQLIAAARAERLSTIDADAAAEQERVEQIEREYMERLEREREAEVPGEVVADAPPPIIDSEDRQPPAEPSKDVPFEDDDEVQVPIDAAPPAEEPGA